ncbi:MAG: flagellar biosynthesis protein FlhA [Pseudomonadota bacterium]
MATAFAPAQVFQAQLGAPLLLLAILAMMILPIPPILLDLLFTFNITLSLLVLLVTIYVVRPLEFGVFPTILLISTLLRLALNIASTRVVLLHGHNGPDAAGKVIEAFGAVVIGGNFTVGIVVFLILIIINFVVVTKGAGRISEVTARFTLDAMPGKQMAIDADLNAGLIDQDQARARRDDVRQEADFYGSMDGASKFVRGDAVAGILILIINLVGGVAIGVLQHDLNFSEAMKIYAVLTIGDGLVAQIPALLLSTGTAIIVTRVNTSQDMGGQILTQMFASPQSLFVTAGILGIMGIIPGMPHVAFLGLAACCGYLGFHVRNTKVKKDLLKNIVTEQPALENTKANKKENSELAELGWDNISTVDTLGIDVGYRLIPLVDEEQGGKLLKRIKGVRKKVSQDLGFLYPSVHIRDNLELPPTGYRILLLGSVMSSAEIMPDKDLAINPGKVFGNLPGTPTKDPAYGLDAIWIDPQLKEQAQALGYTVVDSATVIATHLSYIMTKHAHEIIGHEEVQELINQLSKTAPKLIENLTPKPLPLSRILKVIQNLLKESIPVRDFRSISESLAEAASRRQDTEFLTQEVRKNMSRAIIQNLMGPAGDVSVITLSPDLENLLGQAVQQSRQVGGSESDAVLDPAIADRIQKSAIEASKKMDQKSLPTVLLVSGNIRAMLYKFLNPIINNLHVISYAEVPSDKKITVISQIGSKD